MQSSACRLWKRTDAAPSSPRPQHHSAKDLPQPFTDIGPAPQCDVQHGTLHPGAMHLLDHVRRIEVDVRLRKPRNAHPNPDPTSSSIAGGPWAITTSRRLKAGKALLLSQKYLCLNQLSVELSSNDGRSRARYHGSR